MFYITLTTCICITVTETKQHCGVKNWNNMLIETSELDPFFWSESEDSIPNFRETKDERDVLFDFSKQVSKQKVEIQFKVHR